MKVKVILQTDVPGLGEVGDVKEVAGGYARNYLLPKGMVIPATKGNLKTLEQQHARVQQKLEQQRAEARRLADRLSGVTLDFPVRVGEQGRLYGSVTVQDIANRLKESGIEIDRRAIDLKEPLRALGQFDVPVRVAHAVSSQVKVIVRDQNVPVAAQTNVPQETPPATEAGPETLGENAVPLGAVATDTVVPASETTPEPLEPAEQSVPSEETDTGTAPGV